ncbi:hypothetical protein BH11PSE8_BH11PSE8_20140 [soil metagenome]
MATALAALPPADLTALSLLLDEALPLVPSAAEAWLAALPRAHRHLLPLLRDMLDEHRADAGRLQLRPKAVDMAAITVLCDAARLDLRARLRLFCQALANIGQMPERIESRAVSAASDVRELGVMLYELLVGSVPQSGARGHAGEAVHSIRCIDTLPPSRADIAPDAAALRALPHVSWLRALLVGGLDAIVLKALRTEPAERYGSVEHLADDIRRFLA